MCPIGGAVTIAAEPSRHKALREQLEERHRAAVDPLDAQIADTMRARSDVTEPGDAADLGTQMAETERMELVTAAMRQQVARLQDALERHETGGYGQCVRCGKDIPAERLQAMPWAVHCVPCQQQTDRR